MAQGNLGLMYAKGQGVPQDYKEAFKWYRKAAQQGDAGAQFNLGKCYLLGEGGMPKDYVLAHVCFSLAAANHALAEDTRKLAAENRIKLQQQMTKEQIAEAQRLAREWKPKKQRMHAPEDGAGESHSATK